VVDDEYFNVINYADLASIVLLFWLLLELHLATRTLGHSWFSHVDYSPHHIRLSGGYQYD